MLRALWQDLRLGLRSLRKEPASAVITSLTLAVAIGLCTMAFSLLYGVFFRGLDVPEADRLTLIYRSNPARNENGMLVGTHDFHDWSAQQAVFEGLAHYRIATIHVGGREGPERFVGAFVSANLFDLLRVRPVLGTTFRLGDDRAGAPLTMVLSYDAWVNRYARDSAVVGKTLIANGEVATILGVMPKGFRFPVNEALWIAQRDTRAATPDRSQGPQYWVVGRLKDEATTDQAKVQMAQIAQRLAREYPASNEGITTQLRSFVEADTGPELVTFFGSMQAATLLLLLIAIVNVANLLMARATLRVRETAVRMALGATRLRAVLPFFAETMVLAVIGALLGVGLAYAGITLFDGATQDTGKNYYMVFGLEGPVLLFMLGITILSALLASAGPVFYVLKTSVPGTLKDESRGSSGILGGRVTKVLVATEIALSCALLIGAGLMVRSIVALSTFNYPFGVENILTARVSLFDSEYSTVEARRAFLARLQERLAALSGVGSVALTTSLPVRNADRRIGIAGEVYTRDHDHPLAKQAIVSSNFFPTFGVTILRGRDFTISDDATASRVAIVNQLFADRFLPGREALGQRFAETAGRDSLGPWMTIVGVAPNLRMEGFALNAPGGWGYYVPMAQHDPRSIGLAIHAPRGEAMGLVPAVREVVRTLNPSQPIYDVRSMEQAIYQQSWFYYVFGGLIIVFGAAALVMATVGLYGVLSFSVSRRTKEMGIRMALGASSRDVIRLVLRQGGKQIVVGLVLGLLAAYGLTRMLALLMFGVTPRDPPVFIAVVLVIGATGLLASLVPARRATRAEPAAALRYE